MRKSKTKAPKRKVTTKKVVKKSVKKTVNKQAPKPMTKREFEKLPVEQKRIVIARDIIEQIKAKKLVAKKGCYIDMDKQIDINKVREKDVRKNYKNIQECHVCAIGAAIMSSTKFQNKLTFGDIYGNIFGKESTKPKLQFLLGIFEPLQLMMIEDAFEGVDKIQGRAATIFGDSKQTIREQYPEGMEDKLNNFYQNYTSDKRLIAIMKNIIKNKGTFKP